MGTLPFFGWCTRTASVGTPHGDTAVFRVVYSNGLSHLRKMQQIAGASGVSSPEEYLNLASGRSG